MSSIQKPTLTLLPDLPIEIRRQIWAEALPGPRVITFWLRFKRLGPLGEDGKPVITAANPMDDLYVVDPELKTVKIKTNERPPSLLSACQESRGDAMKKYTLHLDTTSNA